jgi:hypothetical protein
MNNFGVWGIPGARVVQLTHHNGSRLTRNPLFSEGLLGGRLRLFALAVVPVRHRPLLGE